MKVALFSGPIEYSVCLANALSSVCEVTFFYNGRYAEQRDASILDILNPEIKKQKISSYRIRDIRNILSYLRIFRSLSSFDIVHIQFEDIWFGLLRTFFKKCLFVYTVHDPYQHQGIKNGLYQDLIQGWLIKRASKFVVHGKKMKLDLIDRYLLDEKRVYSIPHGEFSFYSKMINREEKKAIQKSEFKRVLFFGSIRPNKGLNYLIKAEPYISEKFSNYKICIAGKFPENLKGLKESIMNNDKFEIFDEFIPNSQVANFFESSDFIVLPYITATQSGVLPLAFGLGRPVVATNAGSIGEYLEHGKTGLLVPPCDERALADAILKLMLDEKLLGGMSENAARYCKEKLSWDLIARDTVEIYNVTIKRDE